MLGNAVKRLGGTSSRVLHASGAIIAVGFRCEMVVQYVVIGGVVFGFSSTLAGIETMASYCAL